MKIAEPVKMYSITYKYINEPSRRYFYGTSYGLNPDEGVQVFISRNPGVVVTSVQEIKLK